MRSSGEKRQKMRRYTSTTDNQEMSPDFPSTYSVSAADPKTFPTKGQLHEAGHNLHRSSNIQQLGK